MRSWKTELGVIAAIITIFGFVTGIINLHQLKNMFMQPSARDTYSIPGDQTKEASIIKDNNTYNILFSEDFSKGLNGWILFGSPQSRIINTHGHSNVFDNNGDGWCNSGAISDKSLNLLNGGTIEAEVYLQVDDYSGCWVGPAIGLSKLRIVKTGDCANDEYEHWLVMGLEMVGDKCWGNPEQERRHSFIAGDGFHKIIADKYINGWHKLKAVIDVQGYADIYIGDKHIAKATIPIPKDYLDNTHIYLGNRSSGVGGKAYIDNLVVRL